jgi:hypothetical protein
VLSNVTVYVAVSVGVNAVATPALAPKMRLKHPHNPSLYVDAINLETSIISLF